MPCIKMQHAIEINDSAEQNAFNGRQMCNVYLKYCTELCDQKVTDFEPLHDLTTTCSKSLALMQSAGLQD